MNKLAIKKVKDDIKISIMNSLKSELSYFINDIVDVVMSEYDDKLVGVVTDRESKSNPIFYRDAFLERLQEFNFLDIESSTKISISIPTMETFDFSGRLKVLETIMSGVAGIYVELSEDDYVLVFGKKPINEDPVDEYVPKSDKIYLSRYNSTIIRAEKSINKKFVRYPFSNTPPIEIFAAAEKYLSSNRTVWIDSIHKAISDILVNKHKGVKG